MRVLVVDDSAFMRRAVSQMLLSDPQIEVVGTARNGKEGVDMAVSLKPDVITLDVEMPEMDGLAALKQIMQRSPTQVLMLSSLTTEGSHATLQALKFGAADFLTKDTGSQASGNLKQDLLSRVRALGTSRRYSRDKPKTTIPKIENPVPVFRPGQFDIVCIGSSTGGPPILEKILSKLSESFPAPVVVAQHMPGVFTKSMAERLNNDCPIQVIHADQQMTLEPRTIYIAQGNHNLHLRKKGLAKWELVINTEPSDTIYWPSVDVLLRTAAESFGQRALGIVLTGIGDDGLKGARELHQKGGTILAQDADSCVVYGMPKAVTENNLVKATLTPDQIIRSLQTLDSSASGIAKAG